MSEEVPEGIYWRYSQETLGEICEATPKAKPKRIYGRVYEGTPQVNSEGIRGRIPRGIFERTPEAISEDIYEIFAKRIHGSVFEIIL